MQAGVAPHRTVPLFVSLSSLAQSKCARHLSDQRVHLCLPKRVDLETRVARLREQLMESAAAPQGPRSPDTAMAVDQEQAAEEEAAAAEAAEAAARELDALVAELRAWKMYFELDDAMQAWQRRYEQYSTAAAGSADSKQELVQGAGTLLGAMMEELLETDWLASLADPGMAWAEELAAASSVAVAVAVPEGVEVELVLSCLPDAWEAQARRNDPSQAWASGTAPFPTLKVRPCAPTAFIIVCWPALQGAKSVGVTVCCLCGHSPCCLASADPTHMHPPRVCFLQGAKLFETESRLRGALQAALQRARGAFCALPVQLVAVQVHSPEGAEGYVRVRLVCKPSAEVRAPAASLSCASLFTWQPQGRFALHADDAHAMCVHLITGMALHGGLGGVAAAGQHGRPAS